MRVNKWDDYEVFEKFHRVEYRNKMSLALLLGFALTHLLMISSFIKHIDYKTKDCRRLGRGLLASILSFLITVMLMVLLKYPEKTGLFNWLEVTLLTVCTVIHIPLLHFCVLK